MPVVQVKSDLYFASGLSDIQPDSLRLKGHMFRANGLVANGAADSIASTYKLLSLPSHVILLPETTGESTSWGYADMRLGTLTDPAALVNQTRLSAATWNPIAALGTWHDKRLWQRLGLAADPGGMIALYLHGSVAGPTGAGSCKFTFAWLDNQ